MYQWYIVPLAVIMNLQLLIKYFFRISSFLSAIKTTENAIKSGGWMVMDAAETLFASAKSRVFPSENKFEFEEVPKWKILKEIIDEIKQENKDDSITLGKKLN